MEAPTPSRAERLFHLGADATSRTFQLPDDGSRWYVCPLCLLGFSEDDIGTDLTEEHVPPKSVGGAVLLLTCRSCNNSAGHTIDAAIADRDHIESFAQGISGTAEYTGRARLKLGDAEVTVDVETGPNGVRLNVVRGRTGPTDLEALRAAFDAAVEAGTSDGLAFTLTPRRRVHTRQASIGDLKSAYLLAFTKFGYKYGTSAALSVVREQIDSPESKVVDHFFFPMPDHDREGMILVTSEPCVALLVMLPDRAVLLPFPFDGGPEDPYGQIASLGGPINFKGHPVPWPTEPEYVLDRPGASGS